MISRVPELLQPRGANAVPRRDRPGCKARLLKTRRRINGGLDAWAIHVLTNLYRGKSGRQEMTRTTLVRNTVINCAGAFIHVRVPGYQIRVYRIPSRDLIEAFFQGRERQQCTMYIPLTDDGDISFPFWRYEVAT